jgi:hypothetical protein
MLKKYLLSDILQYVFNQYINHINDFQKIENIINFKFEIKPYVYIEVRSDYIYTYVRTIYVDTIVYKQDYWTYKGEICQKYRDTMMEILMDIEYDFDYDYECSYGENCIDIKGENTDGKLYLKSINWY